jgi:multiple sugar transport system substrate-binding protein
MVNGNGQMKRHQTQTRRAVVAGIAAAAGGPVLAACGAGDTPAPPKQAEPVRLVFGRRANAAEQPVLEQYVATYRQVAPNVTVELTVMPSGLQEMRQGLITAFAGGTGPDLFISDGPWLPEFANIGLLDPMPERVLRDLKNNFTEGGQRYGSFKGVSYVYPFATVVHGLYYNKTLFSQSGLDPSKPPKTFAEFRDYARRLTRLEGGGVAVAGFQGNNRLLYIENFVFNNKGSVIGEDEFGNLRKPYRLTLGEPPGLAALQLHHDLYNTDRAATTATGPNFEQGTVGMVIQVNGAVATLKQRAPDLQYGIAPLPTQLSYPAHQLAGWSWGIAKPSARKDPAWTLLQWLNSKENILQYVETNAAVTTHKGAIADPRVLAGDSRMKVFYDVLPRITHVRPKAVVWSEIEAVADPEVLNMFKGEMTARQLVERIEVPVNALLAKEP